MTTSNYNGREGFRLPSISKESLDGTKEVYLHEKRLRDMGYDSLAEIEKGLRKGNTPLIGLVRSILKANDISLADSQIGLRGFYAGLYILYRAGVFDRPADEEVIFEDVRKDFEDKLLELASRVRTLEEEKGVRDEEIGDLKRYVDSLESQLTSYDCAIQEGFPDFTPAEERDEDNF